MTTTSEKSYREILKYGIGLLEQAGIAESQLDARILLEFVCGTNRNYLFLHGQDRVSGENMEQYEELIRQRADHIPIQQLMHSQSFMGFDFYVNENVLIPRQDTEILVETMLQEALQLEGERNVLDICTGSGCIILSFMALEARRGKAVWKGIGTDLSELALEVAEKNIQILENMVDSDENIQLPENMVDSDENIQLPENMVDVGENIQLPENMVDSDEKIGSGHKDVTFLQSDLVAELNSHSDAYLEHFDFIVSNPPYIRPDVIEGLEPEVRDHEPRMALDGGEDGLVFYRRIAKDAYPFLKTGGKLFFEIGYDQKDRVSDILRLEGYSGIQTKKDYAGLDRVVWAYKL